MKAIDNGLRKAAILVASLDRRAADLVLDGMAPDEAQQVRQQIIELGPINPEEERSVLEEFFRITSPRPGTQGAAARTIGAAAYEAARVTYAPRPETAEPPGKPFHFLQRAECDKLAGILLAERPQTIALVLSHLPPERAGGVLVRLPARLQAEVIRRLVDLEEAAPEILHEVERALESRLSEHLSMQRRRVAGLNAVAGILEASDDTVGDEILSNLATHDRELANRLAPAEFDFAALGRLDSVSLAAIVEAVEPEAVVLALVGASPEITERILAVLPSAEASAARHYLDHLGPTRLSDVEESRRRLVEAAERAAIRRRVRLSGKTRPRAVEAVMEQVG